MVTSNKVPEKKVVKMGDPNNGAVVPQRTLLGEVNEHITCPICRGYYIDATTIVECLHSFCRSCIIKHLKAKSYCPVCEMMINSAKPNIKLDKALQDIVYKLVPGLFQKEMERRQHFYASRPGPAATATPEQRGEDTERIIFSPEDVISFSLEYADATDSDSISSKSSDSNDPPSTPATTRRFLQCPAVVNISHLKKFLCMKFDIDSTLFAIDILYKRVPLPDYYTLMDIAYIYNWKRNEPMRFFYQIIDYVAIRNRIFEVNRKGSHFRENKSSLAPTEDTNVNSPVPHLDQGSEASSGTDSPMPEENNMKQTADTNESDKKDRSKELLEKSNSDASNSSKKTEDEVEKSQFLNSFELTPKSNCVPKTSPVKPNTADEPVLSTESGSKTQTSLPKKEEKPPTDILKRKNQIPPNAPELKKLKIELDKTKISSCLGAVAGSSSSPSLSSSSNHSKTKDSALKPKEPEATSKTLQGSGTPCASNVLSTSYHPKEPKPQQGHAQPQSSDGAGIRRSVPQHVTTSKRKTSEMPPPPAHQQPAAQKTISPLKIQVPKLEIHRQPDTQKPLVKKIPDLKPSTPTTQNKLPPPPPPNKVRMDLLANNSDPTIDRSKIMSQVKTSLNSPNVPTTSGDPLKSLFDSCKINIPSSLSITLTDQKLDPRNPSDSVAPDPKKSFVNKNLSTNMLTHKAPSPPVHNYIEILKLPDNDPKKSSKTEAGNDVKSNPQNKGDPSTVPNKAGNKSSESSAKGPVPNLKPIADTKLAKQSANYAGPITFQQTFEQQLQSLQGDKKSKGSKNKSQVPKLVPVPSTSKAFSGANKPSTFPSKPSTSVETKTGTALDLSSPHTVQSSPHTVQSSPHTVQSAPHTVQSSPHTVQSSPHTIQSSPHTVQSPHLTVQSQSPSGPPQNLEKAFETMQSIANLAKKQNLPPKGMPQSMTQSSSFPSMSNRPMASGSNSPLRIPSTSNTNQIKLDKGSSGSQINTNRQEPLKHSMKPGSISCPAPTPTTPPNYQMPSHASPNAAQPSPRQIRSPSSSPKLVIAEDKHASNIPLEPNLNQSNLITSTQLSNVMASKSDSPTAVAGPSKPALKPPPKPMTPASKLTANRQPITPTMKPNPGNMPTDYLQPQFMHNALIRHQLEMSGLAWMKQRQQQYNFDFLKSMTNMAHQPQNDYNKDKQ